MFSPSHLLEYGPLGLFLVAFFESTVFPIPPDVLLLPLCLMSPASSWWYAFLTTAASVLGGLLGYAVGRKAGRPAVEKFVSRQMMDKVQVLFGKYGGWAVGVAAFTPLPYKVFTFGAGIFRVPLWTFTIASAIGRSARFFLEGALVFFLGERARVYLGRNFEIATLAATGALLLAAALYPKVEGYLRRIRLFDRPALKGLLGATRNAGHRLRSIRALGPRILAGVSASTVLLLLAVVYLGDLAGPERDALNRSLLPFYRRFSGFLGAPRMLDALGSLWLSATVAVAGGCRFICRDRQNSDNARKRRECGGARGLGVPGSVAYRDTLIIGALAVLAYTIEIGLRFYVSSVCGPSLSMPEGRPFLTPHFLMFGAYLLLKGTHRAARLAMLGVTAVLAVSAAARVVLLGKTDAATATASLLVSAFTLALSYTLLALAKRVRPSL